MTFVSDFSGLIDSFGGGPLDIFIPDQSSTDPDTNERIDPLPGEGVQTQTYGVMVPAGFIRSETVEFDQRGAFEEGDWLVFLPGNPVDFTTQDHIQITAKEGEINPTVFLRGTDRFATIRVVDYSEAGNVLMVVTRKQPYQDA